ncbi:Zinc/iron permease [Pluteus cervinus]|uniref:Zinc/iron permease n=1 Tax=Pluteus cervinus TaxID=181527 RepID=A0ACD3A4H5_9AGAR|nr:Zinc/iron permease [Pluteus cervinus]
MAMIFVISLFAVSFPMLSKQIPFLRIPHILFFIGKHFGTGVILSTAFCHLLQDAFECLQSRIVKERYHNIGRWTGFIILCSLLTIFLIEYLSTSYVEHLQAEPSAPPSPNDSMPPSRASPLPTPQHPQRYLDPTGVQPARQQLRLDTRLQRQQLSSPAITTTETTPLIPSSHPKSASLLLRVDPPLTPEYFTILNSPRVVRAGSHLQESLTRAKLSSKRLSRADSIKSIPEDQSSGTLDVEELDNEGDLDEAALRPKVGRRRQIVGILVLQLGIMIHSLVIGLTLSITSGADFASLVTAISFHQLFEGLSLGIRIAALPPAPADPSAGGNGYGNRSLLKPVLSFLFGITTPAGMLLGMWAFNRGSQHDIADMKLTQGLMNAVSAGMLIYAATVEMIAGDFVFGDLGGSHPGHGHGHNHPDMEEIVSGATTPPDPRPHDHEHAHEDEKWSGKGVMTRKLIALLSLLAGVAGMALIGGDH